MSQELTPPAPIKGFSTTVILDGATAGEDGILKAWTSSTAIEAAAEASFAEKAQEYTNAIIGYENVEIAGGTYQYGREGVSVTSGLIAQMEKDSSSSNKSKASIDQQKIQSLQSSSNALSQISNSARDDATNKQQALSENGLIDAAMDPTNKVGSLVTSLGPAI